jgi:hypothetical protein
MVQDRKCILKVRRKPRTDLFFTVVVAMDETVATTIPTAAIRGGRTIAHVVDLSTSLARSSTRNSINDDICRHIKGDDPVDSPTKTRQKCIQRDGLRQGPGKSIEDRPGRRIFTPESTFEELDGQRIRDEPALRHVLIELSSE